MNGLNAPGPIQLASGAAPVSPTGRRNDIEGLRGVSILAVLLFHASPGLLPGGFIGVDVFFVLSGYLITGLLCRELQETGTISVSAFWARRVKRLAPALLFVLASVLLLSTVVLHRVSGETGALARAAAATLTVSANHFFLAESGDYFGMAAETNPLLHMWSLSVEEQFYLLWPPIVLLLWWATRSGRGLIAAIVALASVSLALSIGWSAHAAGMAFYLMPSRAWELLTGALLAVALANWSIRWRAGRAVYTALAGLVLIGGSAGLLTGRTFFPGPLAALPVLGTSLLLLAGAAQPGNVVSRLIGSRWLTYVGRVSYPLYLWHWPILVLTRSHRLYEPSLGLDLLWLCVSFMAAVFTYEFVERRAWAALDGRGPLVVIMRGVAGTALVLGLALLIGAWVRSGWGYSTHERLLYASRQDRPSANCLFKDAFPEDGQLNDCLPALGSPSLILWGDSHANQWRPAVESAAQEAGMSAGTLTMNGCRPLPGPVGTEQCVDFNDRVMRDLPTWRRSRNLKGLVLSGTWALGTGTHIPSIGGRAKERRGVFFDRRATSSAAALGYLEAGLDAIAQLAESQGIKVLIILPSPVQKYAPARCLSTKEDSGCYVPIEEVRAYASPAVEAMLRVVNRHPNVRTIDPMSFMCGHGRCGAVIDGSIAYTDDAHISRTFSRASARQFEDGLAWIASGTPSRMASLER